ncbi:ABC transporter ATP-binding protein [Mycetocola spongiae]|uniref:ABC transporter ATP-binding protein n=1 Tax=Mycetocola spongiae TaxID=2859226 RepID=UPI001CF226FE|nr:ABC transporter ATP-binding protein [Mycetocola spongiae]
MPDVSLRDLSKSFPGPRGTQHSVLHGVSIDVPDGEFAAILGPSGCGKSTTLRILAGLDRPDSGQVLIDGRDVTNIPSSERGLGMVFQNYALFPHLSVAENIIFGLKVRHVSRLERDARLAEVATQLHLEPYLNRKPGQLSGGQRQRVALGRSLVGGSRLVLMDEPLSNLDARLRAEMRAEIRDLQQRLGLTVLYVTHDQVEAMTMADRVIVMSEGSVDQHDGPEELYARPASARVARFIGSPPMNIIPVRRGAPGELLLSDGRRLDASRLLARYREDLPEELLLGVRAEDLVPGPSELTLPALAGRREMLGADRVLSYRVAEATVRVRVRASDPVPETVQIGAPLSAVHLFAAEGEHRVAPVPAPVIALAS